MSAEQPEEPVAEPQPEEPKGLLQPSRVGIYACLRSDYVPGEASTQAPPAAPPAAEEEESASAVSARGVVLEVGRARGGRALI